MGFFDFLTGKKQPKAEPVVAAAPAMPTGPMSPWQRTLWQAEQTPGFAWKDDNAPARAFVHSLLAQAAPAFGNGKVIDAEPTEYATTEALHITQFGGDQLRVEDRNVELRGVWDGTPLRIPISLSAKRIWTIEMRCAEKARFFTVRRDLSRVPKAVDPSDPWAKGEQQCVFLGKGIFFDDPDPETTRDWTLPHWATVPAEAQQLLVDAMERLDLRFFELSNTNSSLFALGNRALHELEDPIAYLQSVATVMAAFGKHLAASSGNASPFGKPALAPPVSCTFCGSRFILAPGKNTCPNCGAPAGP